MSSNVLSQPGASSHSTHTSSSGKDRFLAGGHHMARVCRVFSVYYFLMQDTDAHHESLVSNINTFSNTSDLGTTQNIS